MLENGTSKLVVRIEGLVVGEYPLSGLVRHAPMLIDLDYDRVLDRLYVGTDSGSVLRLQWDAEGAAGLGTLRVEPIFQSSGRAVFLPLRVVTVGRTRRLAVIVALDRSSAAADSSRGADAQRLVVLADDERPGEPVVRSDLEELSWGLAGDRDLLTDPAAGRRAGWWLEIEVDESMLGMEVFGNGLLVVRTVSVAAGEGIEMLCGESGRVGFHRLFVANGGGLGGERRTLWLEGCAGHPFWMSPRRALVDLASEALEDAVLRSGVSRLSAMASGRCSFGSFSHVIVS